MIPYAMEDLWRVALLLSTLVYTTTSDAIAADSSLEEHLSIFLKVEGLIKTMGLENIWKVKPLLSGTDIKEMFHLESGPVVGHMKEKVLRWQLAHPSRTVERCKDWMRKRYSRLLEESSSLFRLFPVTVWVHYSFTLLVSWSVLGLLVY